MTRIAPECDGDVFKDVNRMLCKLYVLEGQKSSYETTSPWSGFFSINEWNPNAEKEVLVNSITLSDTKLSLEVGEMTKLSAVAYPDNATNMTIKWTSTNPAVVMVDSNGNIYALGEGTAIVTASSTDGSEKTAMCIITVSAPNDIESISEGSGSQVTYYDTNGAKLSKPRKGMNIIKTSNGLIRKVNIK